MFVCKELPWLSATPDGVIGEALLEIKCANRELLGDDEECKEQVRRTRDDRSPHSTRLTTTRSTSLPTTSTSRRTARSTTRQRRGPKATTVKCNVKCLAQINDFVVFFICGAFTPR
ncbi:unnamed protein product, partial [Ixodes persulcatus]